MPFLLQNFLTVDHTLHPTCQEVKKKKKKSHICHIQIITFKLFGIVDKTFIVKYFMSKR